MSVYPLYIGTYYEYYMNVVHFIRVNVFATLSIYIIFNNNTRRAYLLNYSTCIRKYI